MNAISKSSLSPARRRLIELMQRVNFGRIEGLTIRNGEPVFNDAAPPRIVLDLKFGADNAPRPESRIPEFSLKAQAVEMFGHLDRLRNARIESLAVKHGLPFGMHVEASL
jgi:hypothetical protein